MNNDENNDQELISQIDSESTTKPKKSSREDAERQQRVDQLRDLQIEEATQRAEDRKRRQGDRKAKEKAYQDSLRDQAAQRDIQASSCTHRKGGKVATGRNMAAALHGGNDPNYAVVKHTKPDGDVMVICQRCPKVWQKPDKELAKSKDAEIRAKYKEDLKDYEWALRLPTDNEPSGTQMFLIQKTAA